MESLPLSDAAAGQARGATTVRDRAALSAVKVEEDDGVQQELRELRRRCENLMIAVETNRSIGTAIGIVMAAHRVTDERAFELLRQLSSVTQRKLRDIAADIVFTGEVPPLAELLAHRRSPRDTKPPRTDTMPAETAAADAGSPRATPVARGPVSGPAVRPRTGEAG